MRRFVVLLAVAAVTVAMPAFAGPAPAQTVSADTPSTDLCAAATATLAQLPAAPTALAPAAPAAPTTSAPAVYADAVVPGRGIEISEGAVVGDVRYGATFVGEVAGDLPGALGAAVNYTPSSPGPAVTNTIVGGQWALCGPWGTLFGSFTGGTVQWSADGSLADVTAYLTVLGGSVNGVPVFGGAGTFGGLLDHTPLLQGLLPTVSGALELQVSAVPTGGTLPDTGGLPIPGAALLVAILGLGAPRLAQAPVGAFRAPPRGRERRHPPRS